MSVRTKLNIYGISVRLLIDTSLLSGRRMPVPGIKCMVPVQYGIFTIIRHVCEIRSKEKAKRDMMKNVFGFYLK